MSSSHNLRPLAASSRLECQEFIGSQPIHAQQQQLVFPPSQQLVHPQEINSSADSILPYLLPKRSKLDEDLSFMTDGYSPLKFQWTITFRLKLLSGSTGNWRCLFHYGNSDHVRQPAMWLSPHENTLHCRVDTTKSNNDGFDSTESLDKYNSWYHVAVVYYDTYQILYLDGKCDEVANSGVIKRIPNQQFRIFCSPGGYTQGNVEMKNFRMYNRALSQEDIQMDMKSDEPLTTSSLSLHGRNNQTCDMLLKKDLKKMLTMHEFSNVLLKFSDTDQVIRANDVMLAVRSEYFRKILSKEWNETTVEFTPKNPKVIEMSGLSYNAVQAVIQYIYTGELENANNGTEQVYTVPVLLEILKAGNMLLLTEMENLVTEVLIAQINSKNVCAILNEIYDYQVTSLNTFCINYIVKHFKLIAIDDLLQMDQEIQKQVLTSVQKSSIV
ncbi:hypothetical protein C9374_001794 [Naegleria lovaniensis]|uniref:BTB domain-containing protein n=1 Tax=Naegleria lovaniensis TaxID=51637 RepID=A0AA88KRQ3_NAELO|nr:uncharacterized protein C9374_001794 [Naegleria lovaniensis]KAG2387462.1 hypothetical protein C9374_001794 [Naegleria lovaniensis]